MDPNEYLEAILDAQTFHEGAPELDELRKRRKEIESVLRERFSNSSPSIRWGGSMAKGTMIREAYDGDMTCYFDHGDTAAGASLEKIYNNVAATLEESYEVKRKTSALRVKDRSTTESKGFAEDLHIDVVPGRFTSDERDDVFLHQTTGEKERLKTNLQTHIDHIKGSGCTPAIRLMKLWNVRNGLGSKTFVLELLVVKILEGNTNAWIADQLERVWTEFRDNASDLAVEDPANPTGNDLTPILDQVRDRLASVAGVTLELVENSGWQEVFGPVEEEEEDDRKSALLGAAGHVRNPTRPWLPHA